MTTAQTRLQQLSEAPASTCCDGLGAEGLPKSSETVCPMAAMCRGAIEKPASAYWLLVPGALLMVLGVAIVVEPRILVWLVGAILVLIGLAMLFFARALHRTATRLQSQQPAA